jgi:hypothetical protein
VVEDDGKAPGNHDEAPYEGEDAAPVV